MVTLIPNVNRKIDALFNVIHIINIHQRLLGSCFESLIMNIYKSYNIIDTLSSIYTMT
jgi:hypothetical protein